RSLENSGFLPLLRGTYPLLQCSHDVKVAALLNFEDHARIAAELGHFDHKGILLRRLANPATKQLVVIRPTDNVGTRSIGDFQGQRYVHQMRGNIEPLELQMLSAPAVTVEAERRWCDSIRTVTTKSACNRIADKREALRLDADIELKLLYCGANHCPRSEQGYFSGRNHTPTCQGSEIGQTRNRRHLRFHLNHGLRLVNRSRQLDVGHA